MNGKDTQPEIIENLKEKVLAGQTLSKEEACLLVSGDLTVLAKAADEIREKYQNNDFDMCAVYAIKGGRCSENCKFCSQSSISTARVSRFALKSEEEILADAKLREKHGARHYGLVSVGHHLHDHEVEKVCDIIRRLRQETTLLPCLSGGLLSMDALKKVRDAGLHMLHNNLETSRSFFGTLCSTHTYDEKIATIKNARKIGLNVCCGGIFGVGETWEDRIELALTIRSLDVKSVPINILDPVEGTPLGTQPVLTEEEVQRIIAIFRFLLPSQYIRLAAGRPYLSDTGRSCFLSGCNAAITGDMLTVSGISITKDFETIRELGFQI